MKRLLVSSAFAAAFAGGDVEVAARHGFAPIGDEIL
jgi:hypothetical protein